MNENNFTPGIDEKDKQVIMGSVPEQVNQEQEEVIVTESDVENAKITLEKLEVAIKAEPQKKKKMAPAIAAALSALALFQSFGAIPVSASSTKAPIRESIKNTESDGIVKEKYLIDIDGDGINEEIKCETDTNYNWVKSMEFNKKIGDNTFDIKTNFGGSDYSTEVFFSDQNNRRVNLTKQPLTSGDGFYILKNNEMLILKREWDPSKEKRNDPHKYNGEWFKLDKGNYILYKEKTSSGKYDAQNYENNGFKEFGVKHNDVQFQYNLKTLNKLRELIKK